MDALEALRDDRAHAEQLRPLRRPVARRARAVLLAREDDQRHAFLVVALGASKIDICSPSGRWRVDVPRFPGTSWLRRRTFANVPRTITSWLPRREPYELKSLRSTPCSMQVLPGRAVRLDRSGRRDVVRRDGVAEHDQARARPRRPRRRRARADIPSKYGGFFTYVESGSHAKSVALGHVERGHCSSPSKTSAVLLLEHLARDRTAPTASVTSLASARCPAGRHGLPSCPVPSGSAVRSMSSRPRERVGNDERRRGEIVRPHLRVDAPLEVAVPGQHGRDNEVALVDRRRDRRRAAARSCRCTSCSRSRRRRSRALRGTASGRPCRGTRSRPCEPGARLVFTHGLRAGPARPLSSRAGRPRS